MGVTGQKLYQRFTMTHQKLLRLLILAVVISVISLLHYTTTTDHSHVHDIYRRLYYIPVVFGGIWFGLGGGLSTALLVSVIYAPHVLFQWGRMPTEHPEQYLEILLYNVIGVITGALA